MNGNNNDKETKPKYRPCRDHCVLDRSSDRQTTTTKDAEASGKANKRGILIMTSCVNIKYFTFGFWYSTLSLLYLRRSSDLLIGFNHIGVEVNKACLFLLFDHAV